MTTPAEKVALDVMFAAVEALPAPDPKHRSANKLAIVISMVVCIAKEHKLPLETIIDVMRNRWNDYEDYFREH